MSAAILEELKQVRKGNDEILAELRKPASRARRRNMYGEEEE
jgi:hypothetical protein